MTRDAKKPSLWRKLLTRQNSLFMDSLKLYGAANFFCDLGYDYRIKDFKIINGINYVYQDYDSYFTKLESASADSRLLKRIVDNGYKDIEQFRAVWEDIAKTDVSRLANADLKEIFSLYISTVCKLMAYLFTPLFAERILTEKIDTIIRKKSPFAAESGLMDILTIPDCRSMLQEENIDFLKMVRRLRRGKRNRDELIGRHLEKWAWLGDHNYRGEFWRSEDIKNRLKTLRGKDALEVVLDIKRAEREAERLWRRTITRLGINGKEEALIRLARQYVHFRTYRLDMLFYSEYQAMSLLKEIAKRLRLDFSRLILLSPLEINAGLSGRPLANAEIANRRKSYAIVLKNYRLKIYSGAASKRFAEYESGENGAQIIKGNIAFKGIIRGKAAVVLRKAEFDKFRHKDILVTTMTTPDFVPLMKSCSAIVTDEGGITCHAAIISRELKKPCIIGTKVATQIFKDGDYILVDADKGEVRLLERKV